ncbi:MAG: hypothetical protein CMG02_01315 [Candidatus Marinimicrobia bacterium]|nr:hypothetical protein [Candidatus Neomarinimicrobiota bacterium]RPG05224.1 MAG: SGNH/GDSL hydrolase family protein [Pelagibacteraceae bacterium TMED247]|tara:strand:- start:5784 stop:6875 length:1092 start_codon:yes stop_codon:yes gene_type:complete
MKYFLKLTIITLLFFIFFDLLAGNYLYKKFIRSNFFDQDTSFGSKDPTFDHGFVKSYKTENAGWGNRRYTFCSDPNGFRSDCKSQFVENKKFDLAFIGDSFAESVGINFEESFVGLISLNLEELKIANLAASSYSPAIYFSKVNYLLEKGYHFNELIVFLDLSDIQDDAVCYKVEGKIVKRKKENFNCFEKDSVFSEKIKKRMRLSFEFYYLLKNILIKNNIIKYNPPEKVIDNSRVRWTYDYRKEDFDNLSIKASTKISIQNMEKLSKILKEKNISLSLAVYPWPGTLRYDIENNKQVEIWKTFCNFNCKNFYNLMKPFYELSRENSFTWIYQHAYIKDDVHFNEEGNRIIAKNFLKLYKLK